MEKRINRRRGLMHNGDPGSVNCPILRYCVYFCLITSYNFDGYYEGLILVPLIVKDDRGIVFPWEKQTNLIVFLFVQLSSRNDKVDTFQQ